MISDFSGAGPCEVPATSLLGKQENPLWNFSDKHPQHDDGCRDSTQIIASSPVITDTEKKS